MANYDSDSSLDDNLDVQTNVTLGYASTQPTDDGISQIGGHPTFLDQATLPPASLAKCRICNSYMSLLLKLQADLSQQFPGDERRLYIWTCRKKQCSKKQGSVRAFRETRKARTKHKPANKDKPQSKPAQTTDIGSQLFAPQQSNGSVNPFSTGPSSSNPFSNPASAGNPFSTSSTHPPPAHNDILSSSSISELAAKPPQPPTASFADKLKISDSASVPEPQAESDPWPEESSFPTPFPQLSIEAEGEYLEPKPSTSQPSSSQTPSVEEESSSGTDKDLYESPHDKTFDHFTRILSQNPDQMLRYEHSGQPLLYSSTDAVATHFTLPHHKTGPVKGIPRCSCGSARVFELQLVPNLIFELEKDNEEAMKIDGKEGMEWGTVILGTCKANCGEEGEVVFREEWIGVQWEEGGVQLKQRG